MTEQSHTQGKLKVVWKRCAYHIATNDIVVASCYPNDYQYNYVVRPKNEAECIANADFIVRACNAHYDLLKALESFLRAPSIGSNGPGSLTIVVQDFNLDAARAAIAKAKGVKPC